MAEAGKRDRVFVSYSHRDSEWLDRVRAVLNPDIRNRRIQYFDDRELEPGDPWYKEITDAIDHAKVAVLLVSPNFFASKFITEDELPRILKAIDNGLTMLWVPLIRRSLRSSAQKLLIWKPNGSWKASRRRMSAWRWIASG